MIDEPPRIKSGRRTGKRKPKAPKAPIVSKPEVVETKRVGAPKEYHDKVAGRLTRARELSASHFEKYGKFKPPNLSEAEARNAKNRKPSARLSRLLRSDVAEAWERFGPDALVEVYLMDPKAFVQMAISTAPKEVDMDLQTGALDMNLSVENIDAMITKNVRKHLEASLQDVLQKEDLDALVAATVASLVSSKAEDESGHIPIIGATPIH